MRTQRPVVSFLLIAAAIMVNACGGGKSSGPGRSVSGLAGNDQTGPTGGQLAAPLRFVIVTGTGTPVSGVNVAWSAAPPGSATFAPATSTSDASGAVSTVVTLGAHEGAIQMRGTASGLAPVMFTATAVHPCQFTQAYTIGATRNGALAANDCSLDGYFYDWYGPFTATEQQGWMASMSAAFNTWIDVFRTPRERVASNGSGETVSTVRLIVAPGQYVLGLNSFSRGAVGAYTLSSQTRPQTLAGCAPVFVTGGVTIADNIVAGECPDSGAAGVFYGETAGLLVAAGATVKASLRSTAFDPMLVMLKLVNNELVVVAANDDSAAAATTAFVQYVAPENTLVVLYATTADERATGPYTIAVDVAGATTVAAASRPEPLPVGFVPYRMSLPLPPGTRHR